MKKKVTNKKQKQEGKVVSEKKVSDKIVEKKKEKKEKKKKGKIRIKKLDAKWKIIGLVVLCVVLLGVIVYLIGQIPKVAKEVQMLRTQVVSTKMSEQDKLILIQDLEETEDLRVKLDKALPNEEEILDFILQIDEIRVSEVSVLKFSVDSDVPTKIGKASSFLPMTLVLKGTDKDVKDALKKIEDTQFFIKPLVINKEYAADGEVVVVTTQFHLFVSDQFVRTDVIKK